MPWTWVIVAGISVAAAIGGYCFVQWLAWREVMRIDKEMEQAELRELLRESQGDDRWT